MDKAKADVDKWENRAVEAEAELMEIEERKLDEKIAKEQREEEKKKKANSEFTGISEIADETIVGGSGINAVRHLQYGGVNNLGLEDRKKFDLNVNEKDINLLR